MHNHIEMTADKQTANLLERISTEIGEVVKESCDNSDIIDAVNEIKHKQNKQLTCITDLSDELNAANKSLIHKVGEISFPDISSITNEIVVINNISSKLLAENSVQAETMAKMHSHIKMTTDEQTAKLLERISTKMEEMIKESCDNSDIIDAVNEIKHKQDKQLIQIADLSNDLNVANKSLIRKVSEISFPDISSITNEIMVISNISSKLLAENSVQAETMAKMHSHIKMTTDEQTAKLLERISTKMEEMIKESCDNSDIIDAVNEIKHKQDKQLIQIADLSNDLNVANKSLIRKVSEISFPDISSITNEIMVISNISSKLLAENSVQAEAITKIHNTLNDNLSELITKITENSEIITNKIIKGMSVVSNIFSKRIKLIKTDLDSKFENFNKMYETLKIITDTQVTLVEKVTNIEENQKKPWFKKIIRS